MDIEKEIKKILIDKDMTVSDLAEELGTSKQNLTIKLKRKDMMLSYFNKILNVLGFKIAIVKDDENRYKDCIHKKSKRINEQ